MKDARPLQTDLYPFRWSPLVPPSSPTHYTLICSTPPPPNSIPIANPSVRRCRKIPFRLSAPQKARQRKRLRLVDAVVATVDRALKSSGQGAKVVERWKEEMPTESQMRAKDKYSFFDRKEKGYRKGVHSEFFFVGWKEVGRMGLILCFMTELPKWTRVSQRVNPPGFWVARTPFFGRMGVLAWGRITNGYYKKRDSLPSGITRLHASRFGEHLYLVHAISCAESRVWCGYLHGSLKFTIWWTCEGAL